MSKKKINYTSRDFDSIKSDLVDHARRYYPENYRDFNESSFGSMMLDAVAYVGDVMSFYLDYQVNESFLDTSLEIDNIRRIAKTYGYEYLGRPAAYGVATFYVIVPAATSGLGPDLNYVPIVKTGTQVRSTSGVSFMLTEDVDFSYSGNEVVAARFDSTTGKPTDYAIRAYGQVRSGQFYAKEETIGAFQRNRRIRVGDTTINYISKITDSEGHEYYEVDNLSQDVVYLEIVNKNAQADGVPSILKPYKATRRFVVDQDSTGTYVQFGAGNDSEESTLNIADPSSVVLELNGKNYVTDTAFDPSKLLNTTKMGISPSSTTLRIVYGASESDDISVGQGQLNVVSNLISEFQSTSNSSATNTTVLSSIEVTNEKIIVAGASEPTAEEIRLGSYGAYASQNRAVTKTDYEAMVYLMPRKFGAVKRAAVINDPSSSNRRLALYVISEDASGNFTTTNSTVKENLKVWLNKNRMLNDSIDCYDCKVLNIGFTYTLIADPEFDKYTVLADANAKLSAMVSEKMFIGEPFYISNVYTTLNRLDGVVDVKKVQFSVKTGSSYSSMDISIDEIYSPDGTFLKTPKNAVLEIKFPEDDIKGIIV